MKKLLVSLYMNGILGLLDLENKTFRGTTIPRPMGIVSKEKEAWVITKTGLTYWNNVGLSNGKHFLRETFIRRTSYIDSHEMVESRGDRVFCATAFDCLGYIPPDDYLGDQDFHLYFKPPWVQELLGVDKCHINGIGVDPVTFDVRYVTGFCDKWKEGKRPWKNNKEEGFVYDIKNQELIITGLRVPHSPRQISSNKLLVCESGEGRLVEVDLNTPRGFPRVVFSCNRFLRGLAYDEDFLYVGSSMTRSFKGIKFFQNWCGVIVLERKTYMKVLEFEMPYSEIFDLQICQSDTWDLLSHVDPRYVSSHTIPTDGTAIANVDEIDVTELLAKKLLH